MLQLFRAALLLPLLAACATAPPPAPLQIDVFTSGASGFGVTSAIIYGPSEAMVVDAQFTNSDAKALIERIDALDRRVTTIFVTHPDADHFIGLAALHARYPQAKLYMTAPALDAFPASAARAIADYKKGSRAHEAPDAEPTPDLLPAKTLTVDGQAVEIIADMPGDFPDHAANSAVWVPSLKTLIAGDLAFDNVHLWLDKSTPEHRAGWRNALERLGALNPSQVIPGHKREAAAPHTTAVLAENIRYLETFDRLRAQHSDAKAFEAAMKAAYPDRAHPLFLQIASASAS
jgi:glyoxylase-like metal-dependent hydrolase (beta-lactamase superfamily II)